MGNHGRRRRGRFPNRRNSCTKLAATTVKKISPFTRAGPDSPKAIACSEERERRMRRERTRPENLGNPLGGDCGLFERPSFHFFHCKCFASL